MAPSEARNEIVGRLLVVDDHPLLLAAIERLLAEHQVTTTTSGRDALAKFQQGETFDAILCDLVMPDYTGMRLFREVEVTWPDVAERFIFMTGGAFTTDAEDFLREVPNARLEKPVAPDVLRETVAGVITTGKSRRSPG